MQVLVTDGHLPYPFGCEITGYQVRDLAATLAKATAAGLGRKLSKFRKKETVFSQGDPAKSVMYIQEGSVKLTVVNERGKEAVVAILGPGDFLGEGCLTGQSKCMATAIAPTSVLVIEKDEMIRANTRSPIALSLICWEEIFGSKRIL